MNRRILLFLGAVAAGMLFASCSDDDDNWNSIAVTNTELKAVLQQKGFEFNEQGELIQDDAVENTTTLDLSGCALSDVSGLDVFPKLSEVNLSNNNFSLSFDFSVLPATVNIIDLTSNEIYEYPGLVDVVEEENGDETVTLLREITKLYLPESAKYNTHELVYFYENKDEAADMQMADANGALAAYTTLRDIPDDNCRALLKENFPSLFEGEQVDLSNRIVGTSAGAELNIFSGLGIESAEGVQYIFSHRAYKGGQVQIQVSNKTTIPFFKIYHDGVGSISLLNVNTPNGIDLGSAASNIYALIMANNDEITSLDLSQSEKIGQRADTDELLAPANSNLHIESCPQLEELNLLPEAAKVVCNLELHDLPKLKKVDLSRLEGIGLTLRLSQLPECEITYLTPVKWRLYRGGADDLLGDYDDERAYMRFGITEDIYERPATKDFLESYSTKLRNPGISSLNGYVEAFNWTQDYPAWTRP